jgi:hypothetical protein
MTLDMAAKLLVVLSCLTMAHGWSVGNTMVQSGGSFSELLEEVTLKGEPMKTINEIVDIRNVLSPYKQCLEAQVCLAKALAGMKIDDSETVVFLPSAKESFLLYGNECFLTAYIGLDKVTLFLNVEEEEGGIPKSFKVGENVRVSQLIDSIKEVAPFL